MIFIWTANHLRNGLGVTTPSLAQRGSLTCKTKRYRSSGHVKSATTCKPTFNTSPWLPPHDISRMKNTPEMTWLRLKWEKDLDFLRLKWIQETFCFVPVSEHWWNFYQFGSYLTVYNYTCELTRHWLHLRYLTSNSSNMSRMIHTHDSCVYISNRDWCFL